MSTTEAYVIARGPGRGELPSPAELVRSSWALPPLADDEVRLAPLYVAWEANLSHAVERWPVDICRLRREKQVVLGNCGVARVLEVGAAVRSVAGGDHVLLFPNSVADDAGFPKLIYAYDCPGTTGLLARETVAPERVLIKLPPRSPLSLRQWAVFSGRYVAAWSNHRVAAGVFRLLVPESVRPSPWVVGWGGGVALAQLDLARRLGFRAAMVTSNPARAKALEARNISVIDRRPFLELRHDAALIASDSAARASYLRAEGAFLEAVQKVTGGHGADIFIDNLGGEVWPATLKALAREGVVTTCGWKRGSQLAYPRAESAIARHQFVHTHYANREEAVQAMTFAQEHAWAPDDDMPVYAWEDLPRLSADYAQGRIDSYFPLVQVNAA